MLEILPLLVFTTFGGIAAGAYAMNAFALIAGSGKTKSSDNENGHAWFFPLTCIVLLGVGLVGTLMHLGQPLRFINGMMHPGSMISQESYWAIAFGVVMVVDLVLSKVKGSASTAVRVIGAVAACGLMVVTGLAYQACAFIPAWSGVITIPLFIVGDLAMGAGLCLLFAGDEGLARVLHLGNIAASFGWVAVVFGYAMHLVGIGADAMLVAAGAVIGPVAAAIVSAFALRGVLAAKTASWLVLACSVAGVLLVRGAFFAIGIL